MTSMIGKVALVTGGANGIGQAAAKLFAREGACVVVADVAVEKGMQTVDDINAAGGQAIFVKTDVMLASDIENMVGKTIDRFGRLDAAFNNVGHPGYFNNVVDCTETEWDHVANIDLRNIWLCMKFEIQAMLAGGGGAIVNTATAGVERIVPAMAAFTAFKHGIIGLTKSAAKDFAGKNVRVNALLPGSTLTTMMRDSFKNLGTTEEQIAESIPMKRLGLPEEQAEAAVWLCSPRSSFVTGVALPVDGGWSL